MDRVAPRKRMPGTRARHACLRCRRQKLRCDNERPCALCVRSCVECQEADRPTRKRARLSAGKSAKTSLNDAVISNSTSQQTGDDASNSNENVDPKSTSSEPEWQTEAFQGPEMIVALNQDRPSTYGLVNQLLQGSESRSGLLPDSEAIPDATPDHASNAVMNEKLIPIVKLLGCNLPPTEATTMLFDVFLNSVHWFMMVFHDPTLRAELESMLTTGCTAESNLSTVVLILVVLLIGTKYATEQEAETACPEIDLALLQSKLLQTIESNFLLVLDQANTATLQVCILLSSFYFYHGRPNRCLAINSAATRIAQNLKFHQESRWRNIGVIERETRRRVWWALYVLDGYGSITYGTSTILEASRCHVSLPQNIDDTSARYPGSTSLEQFEDGISRPVTTLSYQRFKFRLYRIAEPIMREIYFHNGRPVQHLIKRVQEINQQLLRWEESVPAELRLKTFSSLDQNTTPDLPARIFQLQALALQLSYNNIQLVLHRPLLVYNGVLSLGPHVSRPQPPDLSTDFWESSKELCWTSARHISCVDEYPAILRLVRNFHAASHIGIQTFTAGVMLGIFALSKPFSAQAQEAKRSIGRLIKMPKHLGYRTTISDQTGRILERLLRLILAEELKMLTSDELALHVPLQSNKGRHVQSASMPSARTSSGANQTPPTSDNALPLHIAPTDHEAFYYGIVANEGLPNNAPLRDQDESPVVEMAFVGAGSSTEQLAFHGAVSSGQDEGHSNIVVDETLFNPSLGNSFFDSDFLGELDDLGQGWMWEDCYQFS